MGDATESRTPQENEGRRRTATSSARSAPDRGVHDTLHEAPRPVVVYTSPEAVAALQFDEPDKGQAIGSDLLAPLVVRGYWFNLDGESDSGNLGYLDVNIPADNPDWKAFGEDLSLPVLSLPGDPRAGLLTGRHLQSLLDGFLERKDATQALPILVELDELEVDEEVGLNVEGSLLPELPILGDRGLAFTLRGNEFRLEQPIDTGDLRLPPPFELTDSSLVLFASTADGWGGEGKIEFALAPYGEGELEVMASSRELGFGGHFDFDSRLFETARIALAYEEGALTGSGRLALGEGKLRGVKAASLELTVDGESVSGEGEITPSLAALEAGELTFSVSRDEGAMLSAGVTLGDAIPRVEGGELTGTIAPREEGAGYALAIAGEVNADLPGFDAGLTASLDDGLFDVEGRGAYSRGLIAGELTFGATNREVDGETGERLETPGERITLFGAGEATIALTPWLEGRAGLAVLPQGEVELTGGIGIPDSLTLFEADPWERNLMTIRLDIPIVGFTVARQRVGIFATVGGGLDMRASVGPGTLDELDIEVTYNPDREDETRVVGEALLAVPASAGLRLFLRGGLGAGIPVVSATLGLEAGGELGLEARAEAGVALDWQPGQGLELEARVALQGQPVFRFDLAGFAQVEADLLVRTLDLYDERWQLAAAEAGGGMRFGVGFPIHYVQGEPFAMDWGDMEFQVPRVQPVALIRDLLDRIV